MAPKEDDECTKESLTVDDGVGGQLVICGKVNFDKPLLASQGARDLFVNYQAPDGGGKKGKKTFSCTASCSTKNCKK
jgi:hypothetical protein